MTDAQQTARADGPQSGVVRTVVGDVDPAELGRVSAHEHVMVAGGLMCILEPQFRLADVDRNVADVQEFRASGGGALVDTMPIVGGRSAEGLVEIARRTGVHVVACTGFHQLKYYDDRHWINRYGVDRLAELVIGEIETGMDEYCWDGPDPSPTGARAGVIKIAGELHHVPARVRTLIEAVGTAHRATGAPVIVHTERGSAAHELLDLLAAEGVQPASILLSHLDRNPDVVLHDELAERGAFIGYDWIARVKVRPDSVVAELVAGMAERGHADLLTIGMDLVRNTHWPAYGGGPGLRFLFGEMVPRLARAGIDPAVLDAMCVDNPARWLTFTPQTTKETDER